MGINEEQLRAQWHASISRIAAQIDDLKARIDTESRTLYANLSAEIAALQSDLRHLEAEVGAAGPDVYARQIATQIEELRAKGDAAYDLLQAGMTTQLDPSAAEIRRLESIAATANGDSRAKILARIDELKSAWAAARASKLISDRTGQNGDPSH
ncbi:MAG: hypothetical protein ACRDHP_09200 [Ktedonobacterales bacterium]